MRQYIAKRLLLLLPIALIVYTLVFVMNRVVPGDIVEVFLEEGGSGAGGVAEEMRRRLNLDKPIHIQYLISVRDMVLKGDLGRSFQDNEPVTKGILERLPVTLELALLASMTAVTVAIPVGLIAAMKQDTLADYSARVTGVMALAIPNFWLATLVIVFPAIWWNYSPPVPFVYFFENPIENLQQMYPAALVLGLSQAGSVSRYVRSQVLEVLRQDYVRTAHSKGLRERVVIYRHVLKNALIPVVTVMGLQFASLLSGSVVVEVIFGLPGLGNLTIAAIVIRDYAQLQANVLFFAITVVMVNLIVDLSYGWLDPRVRYQ